MIALLAILCTYCIGVGVTFHWAIEDMNRPYWNPAQRRPKYCAATVSMASLVSALWPAVVLSKVFLFAYDYVAAEDK